MPDALRESAIIDGCTRIQAMKKIVLPLAAPGIAVVGTFSFTLAWGEFIYALVLLTSSSVQTVPIGISGFIISDVYIWGRIMAGAMLVSIPAVLLYMIAQKWLVSGMASGSVKG